MAAGLPCQKQFCVTITSTPDPCTGGAVAPSQMVWVASTGGGSASGAAGSWAVNVGVVSTVTLSSQICSQSGGKLRFTFSGEQSGMAPSGDEFGNQLVVLVDGFVAYPGPVGVDTTFGPIVYDVTLGAGLNNVSFTAGIGAANNNPAGESSGTFTTALI